MDGDFWTRKTEWQSILKISKVVPPTERFENHLKDVEVMAERMDPRSVIFEEPMLQAAHPEACKWYNQDCGDQKAQETHYAVGRLLWMLEEISNKKCGGRGQQGAQAQVVRKHGVSTPAHEVVEAAVVMDPKLNDARWVGEGVTGGQRRKQVGTD